MKFIDETMTSLPSSRLTYSSREEIQNIYPQEVIGVIMWMIVLVRRGILRLVHLEKLILPLERRFNRVHIVRIERIVERMLKDERQRSRVRSPGYSLGNRPSRVRSLRLSRG